MTRTSFLLCVPLVMWCSPAVAQQPDVPGSRTLLNRVFLTTEPVARGRAYSELAALLQQRSTPIPQVVLDSIGDALVDIAMKAGDSFKDREASSDAIGLLSRGGAPDAAKPYSGSFARLRIIFENAPDPGVRFAALGAIARLADIQQSVTYFEKVAVNASPSEGHIASAAVRHLLTTMGEDGRRRAARLDVEGKIKDPEAAAWLRSLRAKAYVIPR